MLTGTRELLLFINRLKPKFVYIPLLMGLGETNTLTGLQMSITQGSAGFWVEPFLAVERTPRPPSASDTSSARLMSTCIASDQT